MQSVPCRREPAKGQLRTAAKAKQAQAEAKQAAKEKRAAEKAAQPQDNDFGLGALRELCE